MFGALVGALFLAVLLVITVWGLSPIEGALVVSALPLAALGARPLDRRAVDPLRRRPAERCCSPAGCSALALLPSTSTAFAACSLALCGVGLGLAVPALTRRAVQPDDGLVHDGTITIGARHAGLVVALALVAPLLSHSLRAGRATRCSAPRASRSTANAPIRQKVPIALDLRNALATDAEGQGARPGRRRSTGAAPRPTRSCARCATS